MHALDRSTRLLVALTVTMLLVGACSSTDEGDEAATTSQPAAATTSTAPASTTSTTSTTTTIAATSTTVAAVPAALAPDAVPGEVYYAPFPRDITVDGDLAEWEGVPIVTIPPTSDSVIGATSARFAATADDEYLYLMGDVTDARIVTGQHGTDYWNEDSIEFYINGTGDLQLGSYTDGVVQITVPPLNAGRASEEVVLGGIRTDDAEATVAVIDTSDGYAVELAVPLKNRVWNIQREHGNSIGFQVHLNSASESNRDLKVIWSVFDTADTSYLNPSVFGALTFFRIGETSVAAPAPVDEGPPREPAPADAAYRLAATPPAERVDDLLARMTLANKIAQMTLVEKNSIVLEDIARLGIGGLLSGGGGGPEDNTPEAWAAMVNGFQEEALASPLGIPLLYGVDAVHGHNNVRGAVIFPHNVGLGAANDPDLMERIGRVTAREMIATGIYWNYAPAVSVPRDIRWGRTYEGYSEDTAVVTELSTGYIRGLQGDDLGDPDTVLATPKHYIGDGGTAWGSSTTGDYQIDQGVTEAGEDELRAVHLPPYVAAIEEGALSVMVSYSSWGDAKMHAQEYLISDVLIGELGYPGFVLSDWGAIDQISNDYYEAVVAAINAGIDMNMVPHDYRRFITTLTDAVAAGDVTEERIDEAVRRILIAKFALGLFERPYADEALIAAVGSDEHRAVAREAVAKSQVLLRNDDALLPLNPDLPGLYVGGRAANDIGIQSGGWTISWQGEAGDITPGTTILEAIRDTVAESTTVAFDPFGRFEGAGTDQPLVCLAVVGEEPYAEGFGDSADLKLPVADLRLLSRMRDRCDRLAVILISGRPLIVTDLVADWDALVAAWLPGTEGQGVADVLFGIEPFSGVLPYTWPSRVEQLPRDSVDDPLFPLGFGIVTG